MKNLLSASLVAGLAVVVVAGAPARADEGKDDSVAAQASRQADKPGVKPGEWSYSMKTEMPGMPFAMPAMTFKHCVTQEDADKGDAYRNSKEQQGDCKTENLKQGKGSASYDVVCTGKHPMNG